MMAWWSYIVLVSAYRGRVLLFHLFWMIVLIVCWVEYLRFEVVCFQCL
jgi:hypothetical protein